MSLLSSLDHFREILELFSGDLPHLHIQSHCRCPGSHPRVHPSVQQYCIPNGVEDRLQHRVSRLNPEAHPLSFINDDDVATSWISHVFTNITQLNQGVTISIDLENGQYQVIRSKTGLGTHALVTVVKCKVYSFKKKKCAVTVLKTQNVQSWCWQECTPSRDSVREESHLPLSASAHTC